MTIDGVKLGQTLAGRTKTWAEFSTLEVVIDFGCEGACVSRALT